MDPQHAQQLGAAVIGVVAVFSLIITAVLIFLYWRCLSKAGLSGALSLLVLIPVIGFFIPLFILAFSQWAVVPVAAAAPYYPQQSYPPPPPPPSYPPLQS